MRGHSGFITTAQEPSPGRFFTATLENDVSLSRVFSQEPKIRVALGTCGCRRSVEVALHPAGTFHLFAYSHHIDPLTLFVTYDVNSAPARPALIVVSVDAALGVIPR